MRSYVRLGRPQRALHQFDLGAVELRRELDLTPAPETIDLCGRIRARSPV
jgi:hypothetical protein